MVEEKLTLKPVSASSKEKEEGDASFVKRDAKSRSRQGSHAKIILATATPPTTPIPEPKSPPVTAKKLVRLGKGQQQDQNWLLVKRPGLGALRMHKLLYDKLGIAAFKGVCLKLENLAGPDYFSFNTRILTFADEKLIKKSAAINKAKDLTSQFQQFLDQRDHQRHYQRYLNALLQPQFVDLSSPNIKEKEKLELKCIPVTKHSIVELIQEYVPDGRKLIQGYVPDGVANTTVVFNSKRREETFWPVVVNRDSEQEKFGLHIYPWLSRSEGEFRFSGFEYFVTAMCMFGASLKGVDQYGASFPLINVSYG